MTAQKLYCAACDRLEPLDGNWWALRIDADGGFHCDPLDSNFIRYQDRHSFACGQGSALALFERYLHHGSFDTDAQALHLALLSRIDPAAMAEDR